MAVDDKFVNIKDLRPGMKNVTCVFIVIDKGTTNQTKDGSVVRKCRVADRSGSVSFSLWNEQAEAIEPGDILRLTKGYVAIWKDSMTLYSGKYGRLEKIGDFTMVFSESPDMSDPNQDFVLQHQRQNASTVAGSSGRDNKSGPSRGGMRMTGPGSAARAGHGGTRAGLGGGGTRAGLGGGGGGTRAGLGGGGGGTRHAGYDARPGMNGTRMGPSGLAVNRNGNNQMGMAVPTATLPLTAHRAETVGESTSTAPASTSPDHPSHPKAADRSQPSSEWTPNQQDPRLPSPLPNHEQPLLLPDPRLTCPNTAQPPHHPTSFQPGTAPQPHHPRQQIPNVQRPPGPPPHPPRGGGYSPRQRGMLLQSRSGTSHQFRPRLHQPMQNTAPSLPGTVPNIQTPNPPGRYQPYPPPPCRLPAPERQMPPRGWR